MTDKKSKRDSRIVAGEIQALEQVRDAAGRREGRGTPEDVEAQESEATDEGAVKYLVRDVIDDHTGEVKNDEILGYMRAKTDLRNWLGFLLLRMAPNAQEEIRQGHLCAPVASRQVQAGWCSGSPRTRSGN